MTAKETMSAAGNQYGWTDVHEIIRCGREDALREMLAKKEKQEILELVNVSTIDGYTALMSAVSHGNRYIADYLLANGANVQSKDMFGVTALHLACDADIIDAKMVKLLIKAGADVNAQNNLKRVPIYTLLLQTDIKLGHRRRLPSDVTSDNLESFKMLLPLTDSFLYRNSKNVVHESICCLSSATLELILQVQAKKNYTQVIEIDELFFSNRNSFHCDSHQMARILFKYYLKIQPDDILKELVTFAQHLLMIQYLVKCGLKSEKKSLLIICRHVLQHGGIKSESDKLIVSEIMTEIQNPILTLKQLSTLQLRKYIQSKYLVEWEAYCLVKNSWLPQIIKKQIWLQI